MEGHETKGQIEGGLNTLKQYLERIWSFFMRRVKEVWQLLPVSQRIAAWKQAKIGNKAQDYKLKQLQKERKKDAVKAVNKDGIAHVHTRLDDLSLEEALMVAKEAKAHNIPIYAEMSGDKTKTLNNERKLDALAAKKEKMEALAEMLKENPNDAKLQEKYVKAKAEWEEQKKDFSNTRFSIVMNESRKQFRDDMDAKVKVMRGETKTSGKSKDVENAKEETRDVGDDYNTIRAKEWRQEQEKAGNFDGLSKEDVDKVVSERFDKIKNGTAEKEDFKDKFSVHTTTPAAAAKITNDVDKFNDKYADKIQYHVESNSDNTVSIYIQDKDMPDYVQHIQQHGGTVQHVGDSQKMRAAEPTGTVTNVPIPPHMVEPMQKHLRDIDYSTEYKKGDNQAFLHIDTGYVKEVQVALAREQSLSSTQAEFNDIIADYDAKATGIDIDNTIDVAGGAADIDVDIEIGDKD